MAMVIDDFGGECHGGNRAQEEKKELSQPVMPFIECGDKSCDRPSLVQFTHLGSREYMAVGATRPTLPAGVYKQDIDNKGNPIFGICDIKIDQLIELPDSLHKRVLDEITDFWTKGGKFREYGFLHRRGYILYGPAGGGKTCIVQQVISRIVNDGDIVMLCGRPDTLIRALSIFRQVEPDRRVVCVFEDIDSIINEHGDERILALLDGENQIDKTLNVATTNYPERLDPRIVARPRRFDRIIKVGMPSEAVRREYLKHKLKVNGDDLDEWVKKSDGFSFAALAEMVISVKCLGNGLDDTVKVLRDMSRAKASSDEYKNKIGI